MTAAKQFVEDMPASELFESAWETLPSSADSCLQQALLTEENFHTAIIERYNKADDMFTLRIPVLGKTITCSRLEISRQFVGLIPTWLMAAVYIHYCDVNGEERRVNLAAASSDVFNKWFHVFLQEEPIQTTPSGESTVFQRRIQLASWMRFNPEFTVKLEYSLSHGKPTVPRS